MKITLTTLILLVGQFCFAYSSTSTSLEGRPMHEIHSMMMYNFMKYVEWPEERKHGEFKIGVVGDNEVYQTLTSWYQNKRKGSQTFEIHYYSSVSEVPADCHMVYLGKSNSKEFENLKVKVANGSTLIITDGYGLGKKGSGINFRVVDGKLRFELNKSSFEAHNLKVATELANLAILI